MQTDELLEQERLHTQRTLALTSGAGAGTAASPRRRSSREQEDAALSVDFDTDDSDPEEMLTDEALISIRANEIMANVWMEFNARMVSKTTSKSEFYENNLDMATELAAKELQAKRDKERKAEVRVRLFRTSDNSVRMLTLCRCIVCLLFSAGKGSCLANDRRSIGVGASTVRQAVVPRTPRDAEPKADIRHLGALHLRTAGGHLCPLCPG